MMTIWTPTLESGAPVYRALVDALEADLAQGRVQPGDRLPTQRDLARHLGVSLGTITRAYGIAERRGLLRGEVGRGTFVDAPSTASLPVGQLGETHGGAVNLSMTWPLPGLDPDLPAALRRLGKDSSAQELLGYQPNAGLPRHREAGARWVERYGLECPPERIAVCAGTQHGMVTALGSTLRAGDGLLCEELTYPGIRAVADFLGLELIGLESDGDGLRPDALDAACRVGRGRALYTVPTLHNPTGVTQSLDRRKELVDVARHHGLPIVEDGIHHLLPPVAPPPLAQLAPELTTFLAAPSKCVAGGLRVGFMALPEGRAPAVTQAIWSTVWMVPPLCVEVFTRWIEDGTADATVEAKRAESELRAELARSVLTGRSFALNEGAYHAWVDLPEEHLGSSAQFAEDCEGRGVLVAPSESFHVGTGSAPRAIRASLSAPRSRETLARGLECLAQALDGPFTPGSPRI